MIRAGDAARQIERVSGLPGFPPGDAGQRELIRALVETASNQHHAVWIIDQALQQRFAPTPADLREISARMGSAPSRSSECRFCDGNGYRAAYTIATWIEGGVQYDDISRARYDELRGKLPGIGQQEVYEGVLACPHCRPRLQEIPDGQTEESSH